MYEALKVLTTAIATTCAWVVLALVVVTVHDHNMPEDSRILWVCSMMGNHQCGEDTPRVMINIR